MQGALSKRHDAETLHNHDVCVERIKQIGMLSVITKNFNYSIR